jgi:hypothetical protein
MHRERSRSERLLALFLLFLLLAVFCGVLFVEDLNSVHSCEAAAQGTGGDCEGTGVLASFVSLPGIVFVVLALVYGARLSEERRRHRGGS